MAPSETSSAEELMSAYLDRELDEEESAAFEAQLAASPEAQEELAELQQMLQLVKGLPEVEAPADFYEKVAKKIRRRKLLEGDLPVFVTLPFQVLSVIVVLAIAVVYTMIHLDRDPAAKLEKDPKAAAADSEGEAGATGGDEVAPTPD
jgi:anti-sigma factor RsiW